MTIASECAKMGRRLTREIEDRGVRVVTRKRMRELAHYEHDTKRIVIGPLPSDIPRIYRPRALQKLVALAHEFGHHQSHVANERRSIGWDPHSVYDSLVEETRAWSFARRTLKRIGFRWWSRFEIFRSEALMGGRLDVIERESASRTVAALRARCPRCSDRKLFVWGTPPVCFWGCNACGHSPAEHYPTFRALTQRGLIGLRYGWVPGSRIR